MTLPLDTWVSVSPKPSVEVGRNGFMPVWFNARMAVLNLASGVISSEKVPDEPFDRISIQDGFIYDQALNRYWYLFATRTNGVMRARRVRVSSSGVLTVTDDTRDLPVFPNNVDPKTLLNTMDLVTFSAWPSGSRGRGSRTGRYLVHNGTWHAILSYYDASETDRTLAARKSTRFMRQLPADGSVPADIAAFEALPSIDLFGNDDDVDRLRNPVNGWHFLNENTLISVPNWFRYFEFPTDTVYPPPVGFVPLVTRYSVEGSSSPRSVVEQDSFTTSGSWPTGQHLEFQGSIACGPIGVIDVGGGEFEYVMITPLLNSFRQWTYNGAIRYGSDDISPPYYIGNASFNTGTRTPEPQSTHGYSGITGVSGYNAVKVQYQDIKVKLFEVGLSPPAAVIDEAGRDIEVERGQKTYTCLATNLDRQMLEDRNWSFEYEGTRYRINSMEREEGGVYEVELREA